MGPELVRHLNALDSPTLGARIKAARLAAGLTQPALAGEDASVAYISRIERGERRPGPALLEVFAAKMDVSPDQLVLGYADSNQSEAELELDYGELALTAGESANALEKARHVLDDLEPDGQDARRARSTSRRRASTPWATSARPTPSKSSWPAAPTSRPGSRRPRR